MTENQTLRCAPQEKQENQIRKMQNHMEKIRTHSKITALNSLDTQIPISAWTRLIANHSAQSLFNWTETRYIGDVTSKQLSRPAYSKQKLSQVKQQWKKSLAIENFIQDMGLKLTRKSLLKMDNQASLKDIKHQFFRKRGRHISIKYHFVKDTITSRRMNAEHVSSQDNLADLLSKPVDTNTFKRLKKRILNTRNDQWHQEIKQHTCT